jgi:DNA-binding GntR family transcriptional regulator
MRIRKSEPLHIQAYLILKQMIIDGQLNSDERIVETQWAERLGISRGPFRECIRMLIQDGLLVQKGTAIFVYEPTMKDAHDLYVCRQQLESLAARLAAQHISEGNLMRLLDIVERTKEALHHRRTVPDIVSFNQLFHQLIIESSQNTHLIEMMKTVQSKVTYMRNRVLTDYSRTDSYIDEHERIAIAIRDRDPQRAQREMSQHIENDMQAFCLLFD